MDGGKEMHVQVCMLDTVKSKLKELTLITKQ